MSNKATVAQAQIALIVSIGFCRKESENVSKSPDEELLLSAVAVVASSYASVVVLPVSSAGMVPTLLPAYSK